MYYLYPRIPLPTAERLIQERASLSVEALCKLSDISHETIQFAPTGGNRISLEHLQHIQNLVRDCAADCGYPDEVGDLKSREFDIKVGEILHKTMMLHSSEASHIEMWAFITCILLPDVVRWRFSNSDTLTERFIGSDRGLRRNTFGRLWWRAFLLHQPRSENPYELIALLYEDELVQVTERNSIAASQLLLQSVCISFLDTAGEFKNITRRMLIREAIKRIRRLRSFISFDLLDQDDLMALINQIFRETANSLDS